MRAPITDIRPPVHPSDIHWDPTSPESLPHTAIRGEQWTSPEEVPI